MNKTFTTKSYGDVVDWVVREYMRDKGENSYTVALAAVLGQNAQLRRGFATMAARDHVAKAVLGTLTDIDETLTRLQSAHRGD